MKHKNHPPIHEGRAGGYGFTSDSMSSYVPTTVGSGPTRPIAICKAALGTKGVHVEVEDSR